MAIISASEAEAAAHTLAQRDGIFAGLSSGLASAILGSKLFAFGRNKTIFCGVLTGVLSGYIFTQAFRSTYLARLRVESQARRSSSEIT